MTKNEFVVFDVETPNKSNNRICSIGITIIVDGSIVSSNNYLVNPEACFDEFNIRLHGVTPELIIQSPTFPELWESIRHLFYDGIVVAHNAKFDLSVLNKVLHDYDIS